MAKLKRQDIQDTLETIPLAHLITSKGIDHGLTKKQLDFAKLVAQGEPKAKAYRKAYETNSTNKKAQGVTASKLAAQPKIQLAIEEQRALNQVEVYHSAAQAKDFIFRKLQTMAQDGALKPSDTLRALELLGKFSGVGAFDAPIQKAVEVSANNAKQQLLDRLNALMVKPNSSNKANDEAISLMNEVKDGGADPTIGGETDLAEGEEVDPLHTTPLEQSQEIEDTPIPHKKNPNEINDLDIETPPLDVSNEKDGGIYISENQEFVLDKDDGIEDVEDKNTGFVQGGE